MTCAGCFFGEGASAAWNRERLAKEAPGYVHHSGKIDPHEYRRTGFPMEKVKLYDGNAPTSGLLPRCNYLLYQGQEPAVRIPNTDPVPAHTVLVMTIAFPDPNLQDEILRTP